MEPKDMQETSARLAEAQVSLDAETSAAKQAEAEAVAALVELVKPVLAAVSRPILDYHSTWSPDGSKQREDESHVFDRGVVLVDGFSRGAEATTGRGPLKGWRLCLSRAGRLFEQERRGAWSNWQGAADWWSAGYSPEGAVDEESGTSHSSSAYRTPAEVAGEWDLEEIAEGVERVLAAAAEAQQRQHKRATERHAVALRVLEALKAPAKRVLVDRTGCRERVCTCHDDSAWTSLDAYPDGCSSCGCRRA